MFHTEYGPQEALRELSQDIRMEIIDEHVKGKSYETVTVVSHIIYEVLFSPKDDNQCPWKRPQEENWWQTEETDNMNGNQRA